MRRAALAFAVALAATTPLAACDTADPLGFYAEPATEVVAPLELTGRVVDKADLFNPRQEDILTAKLEGIERDTMAQLVVVTTPSLEGHTIEDYALALGRGWRIGDKERNDGLLLVVAPNERKVRIEVGSGLERRVDDLFAAEVIEEMIPHFRESRYPQGIEIGVDDLGSRLRETTMAEAA